MRRFIVSLYGFDEMFIEAKTAYSAYQHFAFENNLSNYSNGKWEQPTKEYITIYSFSISGHGQKLWVKEIF